MVMMMMIMMTLMSVDDDYVSDRIMIIINAII